MSQSVEATAELVAKSADYFTANPDVGYLVVIVGNGQFYRPEREDVAKQEASAANSTTVYIYRHQVEQPAPVDPHAEVPEFPAVVGIVELMLGSVKVVGATARQLAEVIYQAALLETGSPAAATAMLEAVADWLGTQVAQGLDSISLQEGSQAATLVAELAQQPAPADAPADQATSTPAPASTDEAPADQATPAAKPAKAKAAPKTKASTAAKAE